MSEKNQAMRESLEKHIKPKYQGVGEELVRSGTGERCFTWEAFNYQHAIVYTGPFEVSLIFPESVDDIKDTGRQPKLVSRHRLSSHQSTIIARDNTDGDVIFIFYERKFLFVPYLPDNFEEDSSIPCKCLEIPENVSESDIIKTYLPQLFRSSTQSDCSQVQASKWKLGDGIHRTTYSDTEISKGATKDGRIVYWSSQSSDIVLTSNVGLALTADIVRYRIRYGDSITLGNPTIPNPGSNSSLFNFQTFKEAGLLFLSTAIAVFRMS